MRDAGSKYVPHLMAPRTKLVPRLTLTLNNSTIAGLSNGALTRSLRSLTILANYGIDINPDGI